MTTKLLSTILLFCAAAWTAGAQATITAQHNKLQWHMRPGGALSPSNGSAWLSADGPFGRGALVFDDGFILSGLLPGEQLLAQAVFEGGAPQPAYAASPLNKVWKVTAQDIAEHRADFADNGQIDTPNPAVFAWPGMDSPAFNSFNEGMQLPANTALAPYWDVPGTGRYDPGAGSFPALALRGCGEVIIPSQMYWAVATLHNTVDTSLVIEVQLLVFTFDCMEGDHPLSNTVFVHRKIINASGRWRSEPSGTEPGLTSAYLSQWVDPDLGCPFDDYVGSFPDLDAAFVYNSTPADCFHEEGFGDNPPVLGIAMLRGPLDGAVGPLPLSSTVYYRIGAPLAESPGSTAAGIYGFQQGRWADGTPLTVGGTGYGGNEPTQVMFPGLPQQPGAWTEWNAQNPAGDRRVQLNYGPFDLGPGAVNEMVTAYSYYDGAGNHLEKTVPLYGQLQGIRAYFNGCFDIANSPDLPACTEVVTQVGAQAPQPRLRLWPNPARERLYLDLPMGEGITATLYDLHGRELKQQRLEGGGQQVLPLSPLPAGVYILVVRSPSGWQQTERVLLR